MFLYNNYRQALEIIATYPEHVNRVCEELAITEGDFDRLLEEEAKYLESLTEEPLEDVLKQDYIRRLDELDNAVYVLWSFL